MNAFKMDRSLYVKQKLSSIVSGLWRDMTLEKTYNRDAQSNMVTDISQQPWRNSSVSLHVLK